MASKMISSLNIAKILGRGNPPILIISSAVLVLVLFFYIFSVGSYFHVYVSPLENRVNYHKLFAAYIINEFVDHIIIAYGIVFWLGLSLKGKSRIISSGIYGAITSIAILAGLQTLFDAVMLLSIPIITSFLIYNRLTTKKILHVSNLPLTYFAILGIAIGFSGIVISSLPLFSIKSIPIRDYAYAISILLAILSPILVLFLVMGSPFKLFIKKFTFEQNKNFFAPITRDTIRSQTKILYLLLFMLLSVTIALIPHLPSINPDNQQVGSDSFDYVIMINKLMASNTPQEFIHKLFTISYSGDRSLASIFFYTIAKSAPDSISYAVDHLPIILGPGLVLAVFFLTRELTSNDTTSLLASFLTAVSFHTLIGMYSGIYANWLALIIGYLSLVFLIRFLKAPSKLNLLVYSILLILLVFTHVYTWTVLTLFTGIFLVAMYKMNSYHKKSIIVLLIVVLSSVAIDVARSSLTGTSGGIEGDIGLASMAGTGQSALLWTNLTDTAQNYAGGLFGNFIIFTLGVYWLFRSNSRELSSIFILIFLVMAVLPLLFGDGVIQSRMLYDIPFQIPAAIGLTYLKRRPNGMLLILPICIWVLAMSVRDVSNFYFISPS
jgi:hypothetical protein